MKVLWFTNTPSNASEEFNFSTFGGGWISALETFVAKDNRINLGICFFYSGLKPKKVTKNGVAYYGVPLKEGSFLKKVLFRQTTKFGDEDPKSFNEVIRDFKPDIIHIFGTEVGYGKSLLHTSEKIVISLQGLMNPIARLYFPPGINKIRVLMRSSLKSVLLGLSFTHAYHYIQKMAARETIVIRHFKYFIGRTDWDKNYLKLINPRATYFHCDELLRKEFYQDHWEQPVNSDEFVIGSTISSSPIKGLDLIYNTLILLGGYRIRWKIFGINEDDRLNKIFKTYYSGKNKEIRITYYGHLNAGELCEQLLSCNCYVHPSYIDNSPNSVCEAMLLGMPILASCVGGIKSLIINRETGFLFNPYDKYDLAGLLVYLINNFDKAISAGVSARQIALKRHSPIEILSNLDYIYQFVCNDQS